MKNDSRTSNSIKNIIIGIISQLITLLMLFISRSIFLDKLGVEYLGLHSFFTNVITVLSMAELGITNIFLYSLYRPLKDANYVLISSLMKYFNKVFKLIASIILLLGVCCIPFLHYFIQTEIDIVTVIIYYLLFLLNTISSYFVVHKITLINADQKFYVVKLVTTCILIGKELIQILLLVLTSNYILYLLILLLSTIVTNLVLNLIANKLYPYLKNKEYVPINKTEIKKQIHSIFLYKFGVVLFNNTDYIIISSLLGVIMVGYYSNYSLIIGAVITLMSIFIQSIIASVGNLNANDEIKRSYQTFNFLLFTFHLITAWCSICLYVALDNFIIIWIGQEYILDIKIVLLIIANFYLQNIINPVWMYRETMGLFNEIKYVMLLASVVNILLSIVFGFIMGLFGILFATLIARIVTTVWYEPRMLYRKKFGKSSKVYWSKQLRYFSVSVLSLLIVSILTNALSESFFSMVIKLIVSTTVVLILFTLFFNKSPEFKQLMNILLSFVSVIKMKMSKGGNS